jgi:glucan phosphoethanolaminetransferase (alkaline phosphatase superfamily)
MKFGLYCIGLIVVLVVTGLLFVRLARNQPSEKIRRGCWTSIITALVIFVLVFSFVIVVSATSFDGKCEMGIGSYAYEACPFEQYFIKKFFLTSVVVTAAWPYIVIPACLLSVGGFLVGSRTKLGDKLFK